MPTNPRETQSYRDQVKQAAASQPTIPEDIFAKTSLKTLALAFLDRVSRLSSHLIRHKGDRRARQIRDGYAATLIKAANQAGHDPTQPLE